MKSREERIVSEDPPTNNGIPEETTARQDVDVLLDVSELEVDKIRDVPRSSPSEDTLKFGGTGCVFTAWQSVV